MTKPEWAADDSLEDEAKEWQKETDICRALQMASEEHYYAGYGGYDKLMRAAKAEIERLRSVCGANRGG